MQYVHPATALRIKTYGRTMPQGIILSGPVGVGLSGAARLIVQQLGALALTVLPTKNEAVDTDKGVISVESIRNLYQQTRTKTTQPQVIIIDYAERMAHPAQNAFLKLLEEPPENTYFILLSHNPKLLLPTIHSRCQRIDVLPISLEQSNLLLDGLNVHDATKRSQLLFIATGLPALLAHLVADDASFRKRSQIVRDARTLIQGRRYEALVLAQQYKDARDESLTLLQDALKLLRRSVAAQKNSEPMLQRIDLLIKVHERIRANGNVRLQLASSVVY